MHHIHAVDISGKKTKGCFELLSPALNCLPPLNFICSRSLKPGEEMVEVIPFTPKYKGKRELIVSFKSKQLTGVNGVADLEVDN